MAMSQIFTVCLLWTRLWTKLQGSKDKIKHMGGGGQRNTQIITITCVQCYGIAEEGQSNSTWKWEGTFERKAHLSWVVKGE